jgi:sensor c-di-GMP phosphodiesterase-like protein
LEKFRLSKKAPDRGNKKRFIKNVLRMIKNPYAYFFWKTHRYRQNNNPKMIVIGLTFGFIFSFYKYFMTSRATQRSNALLLRLGKNVEGTPGQYRGFHHKT